MSNRPVHSTHPVIHEWFGIMLFALSLTLGLMAPGQTVAQGTTAVGSFELQYTLNQLLGEEGADRYRKILPPDKMNSWVVYLPENDSTEIPGVLVYVSPRKSGTMDSTWRTVMDEQNLIYISANESGNKIPTNRRMVLAIMAVRALAQNHSLDSDHISISGFSGGGKVASILASQYPELYTGAIYICGVNFWKKDKTPKVERLLQNRFVFLTGSRDFNLDDTRRIYRRYIKAGAQHSKLMVIPGMAHAHPDSEALTEALQFLSAQD